MTYLSYGVRPRSPFSPCYLTLVSCVTTSCCWAGSLWMPMYRSPSIRIFISLSLTRFSPVTSSDRGVCEWDPGDLPVMRDRGVDCKDQK